MAIVYYCSFNQIGHIIVKNSSLQTPSKQNLFSEENVYSIVLCGGSGTRLWPLSRKAKPKQFLKLGSGNKTLLQASLARVENISPKNKRWVVTAAGQENLTKQQCEKLIDRVLVEPAAKNTAPAIAFAAWELLKVDPDSCMVVLSSDHSIQNVRSFERTIFDAVQLAKNNYFVVVGIQPTFPATGFGYIETGLPLDANAQILSASKYSETPSDAVGYAVRSFREKPNQAAAEQFLRTGKYLWNAGLFVWKTSAFWNAFSLVQPEMAKQIESCTPENFAQVYAQLESCPIDIAFIEQTSHVACVPALFDWNDVGSWQAVRDCFETDSQGNNISGDVLSLESKNCVIHSTGPLVTTVGLEDMVVVATPDAVLVMPSKRSQDVKRVIQELENQGRLNLL
jgi:mannose-1-phosphate guanylyltransferase/mannose-6-phosphate isomerase